MIKITTKKALIIFLVLICIVCSSCTSKYTKKTGRYYNVHSRIISVQCENVGKQYIRAVHVEIGREMESCGVLKSGAKCVGVGAVRRIPDVITASYAIRERPDTVFSHTISVDSVPSGRWDEVIVILSYDGDVDTVGLSFETEE